MTLKNLRDEIDKLDIQLLALLNERAQLSLRICIEKQKLKLPIYHQKREEEVINNVLKQNNGPLLPEQVKSIFQVIIDSCRSIQQTTKGMRNGNRNEK